MKGYTGVHPALRACDLCISRGECCIKIAVLGVSMDSESKQQATARSFEEDKNRGKVDPNLQLLSFFPDSVHVAKRMTRSGSNWFLKLEGQLVNRVLLRTLRTDPHIKEELAPHLSVEATWNRDRMNVDATMQICSDKVCQGLESHTEHVMHTVVPEKYSVCEVNKRGVLSTPIDVCLGPSGQLIVSDCKN